MGGVGDEGNTGICKRDMLPETSTLEMAILREHSAMYPVCEGSLPCSFFYRSFCLFSFFR